MRRLYRSTKERMVAGVLGGIAEYFNIDPTLIRLLFVGLLFMSLGSFSLLYLISVIIIPIEPEGY